MELDRVEGKGEEKEGKKQELLFIECYCGSGVKESDRNL